MVNKEVEKVSTEILESQLTDDSTEVAVTIAGYVAKKLSKKSKCPECSKRMIASNGDIEHSEYLKILSRGGLTSPTPALSDFVCHTFSILDTISPILLKHSSSLSMRNAAEDVTGRYLEGTNFTCEKHVAWGRKWTLRTITNIFFNNHQKIVTTQVRKQVVSE